MTTARRLAAAIFIAPTLAAAAMLAASTPASAADNKITSPGAGAVIKSGSVPVSAEISGLLGKLDMGLFVAGPSGKTLIDRKGCLPLTVCRLNGSYSPGSNGSYRATLEGMISKTVYDARNFSVKRAPATPSGVRASMQGSNQVQVNWSKGGEPDLGSYDVYNSLGSKVGSLPAGSACSGGSCGARVAVPSSAGGRRVGFGVVAKLDDGTASGRSAMSYVNIPAAPKPGAPGLPGGVGGTNGVSTPYKLPQVNNLPPVSDSPFTLPSVTPHSIATDPAAPEPMLPPAANRARTKAIAQQPLTLGAGIAIGLILVLIAAHSGTWMRRRLALAGPGPGSRRPVSPRRLAGRRSKGGKSAKDKALPTPQALSETDPALAESLDSAATVTEVIERGPDDETGVVATLPPNPVDRWARGADHWARGAEDGEWLAAVTPEDGPAQSQPESARHATPVPSTETQRMRRHYHGRRRRGPSA